jgi:hypothetical protein
MGTVSILLPGRCAAEKHKDMTVPFIFTCTVTQIVFLVKIGLQSAPNFILSVMISQHCLNRGLSQMYHYLLIFGICQDISAISILFQHNNIIYTL